MRRNALIVAAITLALMTQAGAFIGTSTRMQPPLSQLGKREPSGILDAPQLSTRDTRLYLDLFGLGPSEIVIVAVVAGLLYGPDRLRGQLRDSGVSNSVVNSKGLRLEREERIEKMLGDAEIRRNKRAWDRVNELIDAEDDDTLQRLEILNANDATDDP